MRRILVLLLAAITLIAGCTTGTPEQECRQAGGDWREFPNSCADSCEYNRGEVGVCAQVLIIGCDCGEGQCWNGDECVEI